MIRAVLDTNVLVSALITRKSSAPIKLYKGFIARQFLLITSPSILTEIEDVINRGNIVKYHKLSKAQREEIIKQFMTLSYITLETTISEKIIIEKDPDDDKFLVAAVEGGADYIVSGDHHLLDLKVYDGVRIITPGDFLKILE